MLLAKFAKIRWTRKISVLQYVDLPLLSFFIPTVSMQFWYKAA